MSDGKDRAGKSQEGAGYRHGRPTIGLLAGWEVYSITLNAYFEPILAGIRSAAQERQCNLLLGCGMSAVIDPISYPAWPDETSSECRFIPVGPANTDGLVIVTPLQSGARSRDARQFIEDGHPVVFIGSEEGGPAVSQDDGGGILLAMNHLVEHGHERIAFVAGREREVVSQQRHRAYLASLAKHGLEADPALVIRGLHSVAEGYRSMRELIETGASFTAVMASNDESAIGSVRALKEAGLRIPQDVAVIGFDNRLEAAAHDPPLASVHTSGFAMGRRALEMVLDRIEGQVGDSDDIVKIPPQLIVRESCGCAGVSASLAVPKLKPSAKGLDQVKQVVVEAMVASIGVEQGLAHDEVESWCARLAETFAATLQDVGEREAFLSTVGDALQAAAAAGGSLNAWQGAISVLGQAQNALLAGKRGAKVIREAEETLHQARVSISEHMVLAHARHILSQRQARDNLNILAAHLRGASGEEQVLKELAADLSSVGVRRAAVVLYDGEGDDPAVSTGVLRLIPDAEGATVRLPAWEFPPENLYSRDDPFTLALLPLESRDEVVGFVALETDDLVVCGSITRQIGLEYERRQADRALETQADLATRRAEQLRAAAEIAREVSTILDPAQLLREAVGLFAEHFDFYHSGIFLVDEPGEYVVLQAASSEGGQRMLARNYRLAIGETSVVGSVASTSEPRIALDVGPDAVVFENPDLAGVRSEMALPLVFHGRTIGVLDIQSTKPSAFTQEDVAILQVAASQLAANIENTRLVRHTEAQLREMNRLYGEQVAASWAELATPGERLGYVYDRVDVSPTSESPTPVLDQVLTEGKAVMTQESDGQGTILAAPIKVRGQVIGALGIQETGDSREWLPEEIALIEAVSDQVAVAIDSARLFGEARIRAEEMTVLNDLAQALAASLNLETVLEETYRGVSRLLRTTNFSVGLYDPAESEINYVFDRSESEEDLRVTRLPADKGLAGYVIQHRRSLLIEDDMAVQMRAMGIEPVGALAHSWLGVPILIGDQALGLMAVQSYDQPRAFDEHDRRLLTAISSQTAIAIQNIRLFDQVRRRAEQEHQIYEITAKLRRSPDITTILQTAVDELGKALQTDRALVRLAVRPREKIRQG